MKATRHNGRAGQKGTYSVKHNDRNFDVKNSEHIDEARVAQNVYWDCYQGYCFAGSDEPRKYTFSEVERAFYFEKYEDHVLAQNERNEAARHKERNRTIDDVLKNKNTCPEESVLQLGNVDGTVPGSLLAQISAEYFEEFEKRFGSHVHILDWALHLDEATPHIHERHVFDALDQYGDLSPQQDKALEELGFELPDPTKKKGKYNNRKMVFDATCRKMFMDIAQSHGLDIDMEPVYGGQSYLEKEDYIVRKLREENEKLTKENAQLKSEKDDLVMKISDVEQLLDEVATEAYEKACDVVTDTVREETQKADVKLIDDYEARVMNSNNTPSVKNIAKQIFAGIKDIFAKAAEKILGSIKKTLSDPEVKARNIGVIKERGRVSIADKLAKYKEEARLHNESSVPKQNVRKGWERS